MGKSYLRWWIGKTKKRQRENEWEKIKEETNKEIKKSKVWERKKDMHKENERKTKQWYGENNDNDTDC